MKLPIIILSVLFVWFTINSCQKGGNGKNQSSGNKDTTFIAPNISISQTPITVLLPNNCPRTFTISNTGPKESMLNYTIADDGALGGFLEFAPTAGSLGAGTSVVINVFVKPAFVNSNPSLVGSSLVLNVYSPKASNFTKTPVTVKVSSIASIAASFTGTWAGTWTGASDGYNNPNQAQPSAAVSGTWSLNLKTIDTAGKTATGSLTWNGTDIFWTYTYDKNGLIITATPNPFIPNRTILFDATNTTFTYTAPPNSCSQSEIHLTIDGTFNQPNPSDGFYGPWFSADFDMSTNLVSTAGNGFLTHPYDHTTFATDLSSGNISGKKQ
ncbi:MAG: hypothetical protein ACHQIM_02000 [Sphingobacteriales bacterium]